MQRIFPYTHSRSLALARMRTGASPCPCHIAFHLPFAATLAAAHYPRARHAAFHQRHAHVAGGCAPLGAEAHVAGCASEYASFLPLLLATVCACLHSAHFNLTGGTLPDLGKARPRRHRQLHSNRQKQGCRGEEFCALALCAVSCSRPRLRPRVRLGCIS